jgi:hypothetical protein
MKSTPTSKIKLDQDAFDCPQKTVGMLLQNGSYLLFSVSDGLSLIRIRQSAEQLLIEAFVGLVEDLPSK